jgi:hypothetical protein
VTFVAIILCVASQRVFIVVVVYFVMTQSGNIWIHLRMLRDRIINQQVHKLMINIYMQFSLVQILG